MNFEDLITEQKEKAKAFKTSEEVLSLAKEEGVELTDKQLGMVAGGDDWLDIALDIGKDVGHVDCPKCRQLNLVVRSKTEITCTKCGYTFTADWPS